MTAFIWLLSIFRSPPAPHFLSATVSCSRLIQPTLHPGISWSVEPCTAAPLYLLFSIFLLDQDNLLRDSLAVISSIMHSGVVAGISCRNEFKKYLLSGLTADATRSHLPDADEKSSSTMFYSQSDAFCATEWKLYRSIEHCAGSQNA